jgi:hypothetical protein
MSPIAIGVAVWLALNVVTVLIAINWAAARKRAFRAAAQEMVSAAELHANAPVPARDPVSTLPG